MGFRTYNPTTEEILAEYEFNTATEVDDIVEKLNTSYFTLKRTDIKDRAKILSKVAEFLLRDKHRLASIITLEMGKPINQSIAEIEKSATVCRYYAQFGEDFLKPDFIKTDANKSYVTYNPLGTVLGIMPWNFPFWQTFRFAAPIIMAGNTFLLKHALNTTQCAAEIIKLFNEASPNHEIAQMVVLSNDDTTELIAHNGIAAVSITGSTKAGKSVASKAGSVLKKAVLELGGNDPYIVFNDADLCSAVPSCLTAKLINGGQSCIAAKRYLVQSKIYDSFLESYLNKYSQLKLGNPFLPETQVGPMARKDLRDSLVQQVQSSVALGANLLTGGNIPDTPGYFYNPAILTDVKPGMPAFDDELFGMVASFTKFETTDEAIALANKSQFGLGAAVFSSDVNGAEILAKEVLHTGSAFVNTFVRSDARLPFGGIKQSGLGRELGKWGIYEFVNIKTVYVV